MLLTRRTLLATGLSAAGMLAGGCSGDEEEQVAVERYDYGDHASQWAELHRSEGDSRGVVVVIHGGFWKAAYDASLGRPLALDLAARGWTAWNVEYRRVGAGGGVPATLDDVAAAIDRLRDVPDLDLASVLTLGHSAGGHLAAWAAARGRFDRWAEGVPVTGVVSQAGVLDLTAAFEAGLGSGAVEAFVGVPGPAYDQADPTRQLPLEVPVRCVHGRDDDVVPISQSKDYVARAVSAGADAELVEVAGDHFVVIDPASDAWTRTVEFLEELS